MSAKKSKIICGPWALITLGEYMQSKIVSDYFIHEYFLIHKEYTKEELVCEFLKTITTIFNYQFNNVNLLFEAFTHKSFAHEVKIDLNNNEKLEFLGDSVLQLVISEEIYKRYEMLDEGSLSKLRSAIVNENTLAQIGNYYKLSHYLLVGKGEFKNKGHERPSLVSDAFEAIIGAIYLDSNYEKSKTILLNLIEKFELTNKKIIDQSIILDFDAKSRLQEIVMAKFKTTPKYISAATENDQFSITLMINEHNLGTLTHQSKKKAMQLLAKKVLENNEIAKL